MTPRRDPHSPANLRTEDYDFAFCGIHHEPEGVIYDRRAHVERVNALLADGYRFADVHDAERCSHCGQRINYYAVLIHRPTKTLIHVGETCLANRFERATSEFHTLRRQAVLDRERQRIKTAREAWRSEHGELYDFLAEQSAGEDEFYHSLWQRLHTIGNLTDRQAVALGENIERYRERVAERKAQDDTPAAPVVEGRIEVTGTVLGTDTRTYRFRETLKMLVLDDRGFKVWGTVPDSILSSGVPGPLRGKRVQFHAEVTRSKDDETFGFFRRPTRAVIIPEQPKESAA